MKLGCLPYLNVRPLVHTLESGGLPEGWEFVYAPPSALARMLEAGEIAAAPVSSFACLRNPDLQMCPGICISADGPVWSVLILSRVPPERIARVALDTSSLSGAAMARIILDESYGVRPQFVRADPGVLRGGAPYDADAVLLIGDPAMLYPKEGLYVLDMGAEWMKLTGLPAVFAVWAGLEMRPELVCVLQEAKAQGLSLLPEIAEKESRRLGLPFETCYEYLSEIITYDMRDREMRSLEVFRRKASAHGLLDCELATR